jgi:hypothetical protein
LREFDAKLEKLTSRRGQAPSGERPPLAFFPALPTATTRWGWSVAGWYAPLKATVINIP